MKLLFLIVVVLFIACGVYVFSRVLINKKGKKSKRFNWLPISIATAVFICLIGIITYGVYTTDHQPDLQCGIHHLATTIPPTHLETATDYFTQGDYDYEIGNCQQAVIEYTKVIKLNPTYSKAYNNRAYTNMRIRKYKDSLSDLDKAISLNPNYVQALMNRGDIHNYYYQIDRQSAIADYKRIIAIIGSSGRQTSVCGHLFLAKHNGWTPGAYLGFFTGAFINCN